MEKNGLFVMTSMGLKRKSIDVLNKKPGVWMLIGKKKEEGHEEGHFICLQIGQTGNIGLEVKRDIEFMVEAEPKSSKKKYVNQFGEVQRVLQEVMEEIGDSMQRMSQMKQSTGELEEVRNEILASMDALSEFAQNNLASTKQTYEQTNEVADTFEKVNSSAEELRSIAAKLADSIRYFKIEK